MSNNTYSASSIVALDFPDNIRMRPDMYIGDRSIEGYHHCAFEIIDNSVDEHLAGHANHITVTLHPNSILEVADDGRGIPTDMHPTEKLPAIELVMTKLHAGGKFDRDSYQVSGGLHGVGLSAVNALSEFMEVDVHRNKQIVQIKYEKGRKTVDLHPIGKTDRVGTVVRFRLDHDIFRDVTHFTPDILISRLKQSAFLNPGLRITFINLLEKTEDNNEEINNTIEFFYENGTLQFLKDDLNAEVPVLFEEPIRIVGADQGISVDIALQYRVSNDDPITLSYVNTIHTKSHGLHVDGFWSAYEKLMKQYSERLKLDKKGTLVSKRSLSIGLTCIINTRIPNAEFKGQTKDKLTEPAKTTTIVRNLVENGLANFLEKNRDITTQIIEKAVKEMEAIESAQRALENSRSGKIKRKEALTMLAGKLADCTSRDPAKKELFIVEGDSAGGSAKQGRNREIQAILPVRGKILNVAKKQDALKSEIIKMIFASLGIQPSFRQNEDYLEKLRYHKVIIMTDADVDGSHIQILLLTFFYRFMPELIQEGYLYIAQPPLYKISAGKDFVYLYSDGEKDEMLKSTRFADKKVDIQRYKGLGEMNADQLWETTMDPSTRKLRRVEIQDEMITRKKIELLMSESGSPDEKKKFILSGADFVTNIDDIG
ncbi:MAG: DNA gyrase/topoisomerase IV subunit B [Brevinema sp.]